MAEGWALFLHSLRAFRRHPVFVLPMLFIWCLYAPTLVYFQFFFRWKGLPLQQVLGVVFLELAFFSLIILCACSAMLEMIRQMEFGEPVNVLQAASRVLKRDVVRVIPLALVWAAIWFLLTILEALLSKRRKDEDASDQALNAQNVAATLADYRQFSLSAAFVKAVEKGIRMVVFLILPAIVWEQLSFVDSVKKGLTVLKTHVAEFASGYALTYAAAAVVFLPPFIILELGTGRHGGPPLVVFPSWVWTAVIVYIGLAWSFCMYLEQMFMASLYFWQMNWEKAAIQANHLGEYVPSIKKTPLPQLLDVPELQESALMADNDGNWS